MKQYQAVLIRGAVEEIVAVIPVFYTGVDPSPMVYHGEDCYYLSNKMREDMYLYTDLSVFPTYEGEHL
jgi:hypothetical protein